MGGNKTPRRLFVFDRTTGAKFLVDTGADISVTPAARDDKTVNSKFQLYAANSSQIRTFGERALTLNIGLRRPIQWSFCIADVPYSIIGADLLHKYGLIIDLKRGLITDPITGCRSTGLFAPAPICSITTVSNNSKYTSILKGFPELLGSPSNRTAAKHSIKHYITT